MALMSITKRKRLQKVSERLRGILEIQFGGDERRMAASAETSVYNLRKWLKGERMPQCLYGMAREMGVSELWLLGKSERMAPEPWQVAAWQREGELRG